MSITVTSRHRVPLVVTSSCHIPFVVTSGHCIPLISLSTFLTNPGKGTVLGWEALDFSIKQENLTVLLMKWKKKTATKDLHTGSTRSSADQPPPFPQGLRAVPQCCCRSILSLLQDPCRKRLVLMSTQNEPVPVNLYNVRKCPCLPAWQHKQGKLWWRSACRKCRHFQIV